MLIKKTSTVIDSKIEGYEIKGLSSLIRCSQLAKQKRHLAVDIMIFYC